MDGPSCHAALAAAETYPEVFAAIGRHPNEATGYDDAITDELREFAQHPRCRAIGETGLDDYRDYAPRADQERAFAAQIALAHEVGKPLIIHTRAAEDDTIDTLASDAAGPRGDPALLLDAGPPRGVPGPRLVDLVRRQRHLPEGARPGRGGREGPARAAAGGDRRPVPDAAGRAQGAQPAGLRRPHRALHRRAPRASPTPSWTPRSTPTARSSSAGESSPASAGCASSAIRPNRELARTSSSTRTSST